MNLLLLLSALLSALTGVGVGVRRPEVAQAVAARVVAPQPARVAAARLAMRPDAGLPTLVAAAEVIGKAMPVLLGTADLWADRRRE